MCTESSMAFATQESLKCHFVPSLLLFLQRSGTRGMKGKISAPGATLLENPRALGSGGEGKRYSTELWEPCFEDQCTHCAPWARVLSWARG